MLAIVFVQMTSSGDVNAAQVADTLHNVFYATVMMIAIAVWPLYQRATRRWPPGKHNILLPAVFTLILGLMFTAPLVLVGVQAARDAAGEAPGACQRQPGRPRVFPGHKPVWSRPWPHCARYCREPGYGADNSKKRSGYSGRYRPGEG